MFGCVSVSVCVLMWDLRALSWGLGEPMQTMKVGTQPKPVLNESGPGSSSSPAPLTSRCKIPP